MIVPVVLVGTLARDTLTFGEAGQLQRLAVVGRRRTVSRLDLKRGQQLATILLSAGSGLQNTLCAPTHFK